MLVMLQILYLVLVLDVVSVRTQFLCLVVVDSNVRSYFL